MAKTKCSALALCLALGLSAYHEVGDKAASLSLIYSAATRT